VNIRPALATLGAFALLAAPTIALAPAASADTAGPITGLAGKCLDVAGSGTANGTAVQLYGCNGTGAQRWTVASDGTVRALGKCLDVNGGVNADGTKVQLWDCMSGNQHQQWRYSSSTKDLVNPDTGKCLDVTGWGTADGTRIQIWTCNGKGNQDWTLPGGTTSPPPPASGRLAGAPYLYLGWGDPPSATSVMSSTGVKAFTMAFMLSGGGCTPRWDSSRPLTGGADASTIAAIKAAGGDVQISFGGWSGNKLGPNCSSASAYAAAVQQVIDAYHPAAVDFDIENSDELENAGVQDRILGGIKIVKQANPSTKAVLTFGTGTAGPEYWATRLITQSKALGVPVDVYTIMPFDFGGGADIVSSTLSAAEGLKNTLRSTFGWSDAQAYAHVGISGMNGYDDSNELTTTAGWTQIRDWAVSHGLARLAFWSVNRDRPCPGGGLQETCSGIDQPAWEFTRITAGF
jgi:Ricin-type beta-trefoil lectin domain